MQDLMKGKRGLIMGIANDHSIAWGIARTLAAQGAEMAFTYQGEALGKRVRPLAEELGVKQVLPCDVEDLTSVNSVFSALKKEWGGLDFLVHAIAFSDKNELKGRYADTSRENFSQHHAGVLLLLHRARQTRGRLDAGNGRRDDHADLRRLDARDAELQCDGRRQGGTGSLGALSRCRFRLARHPRQFDLGRAGPDARGFRHRRCARMFAFQQQHSPLGRGVTLDELGGSALYLLSELSGGVTGEIHYVDSGYNVISMPRPEDLKNGNS